jgi:hypothetical protein
MNFSMPHTGRLARQNLNIFGTYAIELSRKWYYSIVQSNICYLLLSIHAIPFWLLDGSIIIVAFA